LRKKNTQTLAIICTDFCKRKTKTPPAAPRYGHAKRLAMRGLREQDQCQAQQQKLVLRTPRLRSIKPEPNTCKKAS